MVATQLDGNGHERLAKRRRYRLAHYGSMLAGLLGLFLAVGLGYPIVGIGLYLLGALSMFGVLWLSPMELFDERECAIERRAARQTMMGLVVAMILGFPSLVALEEAGHVTITPVVNGAILAYLALIVVFLGVYVVARLRS